MRLACIPGHLCMPLRHLFQECRSEQRSYRNPDNPGTALQLRRVAGRSCQSLFLSYQLQSAFRRPGKKTASADSATTDSTGNYSVKLDTGTYNVLASGDSGVVYQDSITVTKDSAIRPPADTLKTREGFGEGYVCSRETMRGPCLFFSWEQTRGARRMTQLESSV